MGTMQHEQIITLMVGVGWGVLRLEMLRNKGSGLQGVGGRLKWANFRAT